MTYNKGKGKCYRWVVEHVGHQGDDCLIWPFSRTTHGYGQFGYLGESHLAHRMMCELAHGPAPADKPQAAHSCGNGHNGCCNPKHLSWKSNSENQRDRRAHGTQKGASGTRTRLTPQQIEEIRKAKGKIPQFTLARLLGVKRGTIEYWQRTTHDPLPPSTKPLSVWRRQKKAAQQAHI